MARLGSASCAKALTRSLTSFRHVLNTASGASLATLAAMKTITQLLALIGALAACSAPSTIGPSQPLPATIAPSQATPSATVAPASTPLPLPSVAAVCGAGAGETWVAIPSAANLFGAGLDAPPAPGGGGGGVPPPSIELPDGDTRLVRFPCTDGLTDCCSGIPAIGPAGYVGVTPTDVESHGGIAGLVTADVTMFLAGVFLTDEPPAEPAPERLEIKELDFKRLEPALGQTFYIGDGAGKTFVAPAGSTRLFVGFVDAAGFTGLPGWYANNRGALEAVVAIEVRS